MVVNKGRHNTNKLRGMAFETQACDWLQQQGHRILQRNLLIGGSELDIISQKGAKIYFCEVKARQQGGQTSVYEAITADKARRLRRGALAWLAQEKKGDSECCICLIAMVVSSTDSLISIELIEDFI